MECNEATGKLGGEQIFLGMYS